eukprot:scaffold10696_cov157-Alexandrium_tamarense.AAC.1
MSLLPAPINHKHPPLVEAIPTTCHPPIPIVLPTLLDRVGVVVPRTVTIELSQGSNNGSQNFNNNKNNGGGMMNNDMMMQESSRSLQHDNFIHTTLSDARSIDEESLSLASGLESRYPMNSNINNSMVPPPPMRSGGSVSSRNSGP